MKEIIKQMILNHKRNRAMAKKAAKKAKWMRETIKMYQKK
ncbi:hypothetical protein [Staphylococcus phage vB_StaM_SA1]|nr:hypothetical protein [Staphylococcus phage vB_StaM_SA1]